MSSDFSPDQKRYLEGFVSGLSASRVARTNAPARSEPVGPDAIHLKAQDRIVAAGGKLLHHGAVGVHVQRHPRLPGRGRLRTDHGP